MSGTARIEVYDNEGKVVINTETGNYVFQVGQAVEFANAMLACARACGAEIQVQVEQRNLSPKQYTMLVVRTANIVRSLEQQKKGHEYIAKQVVDTILAAVL